MQSYTEIPENQTLKDSRVLLLNNDKTALSNSSGKSFPTQNVQVGQFCFRTDEAALYQYTEANTWVKLVSFSGGVPIFENIPSYDAATSSALGLVKTGSNITNSNGTISITKSNVTNALGYTPPTTDTTYGAATSSTFGLVKTGSNITNSSGTISLTKSNVTNALGYTPPTTNTTYGVVNSSNNGLMSPAMLTKLNNAGDHGTVVAQSLAANGYRKWSDGFIEQWGTITPVNFPNNGQSVAFPISFSQTPGVLTSINQNTNSSSQNDLFTSACNCYATTTSMIIHRYGSFSSSVAKVDWIAYGK